MTRITLHVGTYDEAGGQGLHRIEYDPGAGFMLAEPYELARNASFGAWSSRHQLAYFVDEQAHGQLGIHRRDAGRWSCIAQFSSEGRGPCYVALDPHDARVAIANYGSGSVALLGLTPEGLPSGETALWANDGSGPNADRQEAPHIHCVRFSPDGRSLYAVDLGTDQVLRFSLQDAVALDHPETAWQAPPGSGPRHLLFDPTRPLALLVCELASTLTLFDTTGEALTVRASVSTLPSGFSGESLGGHLAINRAGDRVYVTNRGHDSVAVFKLDADTAMLEPIQHIASEGASPRFFLLLEDIGRLLLVNEKTSSIVAFALGTGGRLALTGHLLKIAGAAYLTVAGMNDSAGH